MRPPRGSTTSRKYTVDVATASESAGAIDFILASGLDNATLGQTSATDVTIPVGAKIKLLDLRLSWASLANVVVVIHWTIQRVQTQQTALDPKSPGGNTRTKNIMLSGLKSVGLNQNSDMHIRYRVPKSMQRMGDDVKWVFSSNANNVMTATKQCIYKVFT